MTRRDTATRQAFIDFASVASIAPLCVMAAMAVWSLTGSQLAGSAIMGGIAVVLAIMQSITWRRHRSGVLAEAIRGSSR